MPLIAKAAAYSILTFIFISSVFVNEFGSLKYLVLVVAVILGVFQAKYNPDVIIFGLVWSSFFSMSILYGSYNGYSVDYLIVIYFVVGPLAAILLSSVLVATSEDVVAKVILITCFFILLINLLYFLYIIFDFNLSAMERLNIFGGRNVSSNKVEFRTNSHSALLFYLPAVLCLAVLYDFRSIKWKALSYLTIGFGLFVLLISGRRALQIIVLIPIFYIIYKSRTSFSGKFKIAGLAVYVFSAVLFLDWVLSSQLDGVSFISTLGSTIMAAFDPSSASGSVRNEQINPLIDLWNEAPIFGSGANSYNHLYFRNHRVYKIQCPNRLKDCLYMIR